MAIAQTMAPGEVGPAAAAAGAGQLEPVKTFAAVVNPADELAEAAAVVVVVVAAAAAAVAPVSAVVPVVAARLPSMKSCWVRIKLSVCLILMRGGI